jgi:hypothetical protein
MHTRTTGSNTPPLYVNFMREFATGAPRFIVHTYTPFGVCVYMGDIKAIDAKHFATGYAYIAQHKNPQMWAYMCVFGFVST